MAVLEGYPPTVRVNLLKGLGCYGIGACGTNNLLVYQGYCGCWVSKCLLCGNVDWAKCCDEEDEAHWEDFEDSCQTFE